MQPKFTHFPKHSLSASRQFSFLPHRPWVHQYLEAVAAFFFQSETFSRLRMQKKRSRSIFVFSLDLGEQTALTWKTKFRLLFISHVHHTLPCLYMYTNGKLIYLLINSGNRRSSPLGNCNFAFLGRGEMSLWDRRAVFSRVTGEEKNKIGRFGEWIGGRVGLDECAWRHSSFCMLSVEKS